MDATPKYDAETAQLLRLTLERVAMKIERRAANEVYQRAFRIAAKIVRETKPD